MHQTGASKTDSTPIGIGSKSLDLRSRLAAIPLVDDPSYESQMGALVDEGPIDRTALRHLTKDEDDLVAFNAVFIELTLLRRDRDRKSVV